MKKLTGKQRQKRIQELMAVTGVDEQTARFMIAQELGEISGDIKAIVKKGFNSPL